MTSASYCYELNKLYSGLWWKGIVYPVLSSARASKLALLVAVDWLLVAVRLCLRIWNHMYSLMLKKLVNMVLVVSLSNAILPSILLVLWKPVAYALSSLQVINLYATWLFFFLLVRAVTRLLIADQ